VTLNGEAKGVTPLDLADLPLTSYEVKVELKGFAAQTQKLELTAEAPRSELKLTLSKNAPTVVVADILSTPFGATVKVDGAAVGQTPLTDFKLKPGSHRVDIEKEGFEPWSGTLAAQPGKRGKVDAQLKAIVKPPPPTTPKVEAVDTSKIYSNSASEVDVLARKASGSSPSYPSGAPRLRSGDSVSVMISFVVTEQGEVTEVKVVESGGKLLDEAVMAAVRNWEYQPASKRGVSVKARVTFKQTFRAG
jgi:TonB family protein